MKSGDVDFLSRWGTPCNASPKSPQVFIYSGSIWLLIRAISRKPTHVQYVLACHVSNEEDQSRLLQVSRSIPPSKRSFAPSVAHMVILGLSSLPVRVDAGRQSWWPWLVSQAGTLRHHVARAAATGPGSLCQLVPDLSDSQAHCHVCHGGHQR